MLGIEKTLVHPYKVLGYCQQLLFPSGEVLKFALQGGGWQSQALTKKTGWEKTLMQMFGALLVSVFNF